jgi:hypothetical protein
MSDVYSKCLLPFFIPRAFFIFLRGNYYSYQEPQEASPFFVPRAFISLRKKITALTKSLLYTPQKKIFFVLLTW